jgi:hypothetical protein
MATHDDSAINRSSHGDASVGTDDNFSQRNTNNTSNKSTGSGLILGVVAAIVVIAAAVLLLTGSGDSQESDQAAMVGSSSVSYATMNERVNLVENQLQTQLDALESQSGTSANPRVSNQISQIQSVLEDETRLKQSVLTSIIDQRLLVQAAQEDGVSVDDSAVDSRLNERIQQIGGEEEFSSRLEETGQTREDIRADIRNQLIIQEYIGTTTDAEVQSAYQNLTAQVPDGATTSVPSLSQIRPQIERQITRRKRQQLLAQARNNTPVEVYVDGVTYPPQPQQQQPGSAAGAQPQPPATGSTPQPSPDQATSS